MLIVDTHVHLASPDRERYPLAPGIGINRWYDRLDASVEALLGHLDAAGVHGAVLVQANAAYRHDNRYCLDARQFVPARLTSAVAVDVTQPDRASTLERLADSGAGGVRVLHVPRPDPPWLDDPDTADLWEVAARRGLRVQVQVVRADLPLVARLLEWAPAIPIALDHAGVVDLLRAADGGEPLAALESFTDDAALWFKVSPHTLDVGRSAGRSDAEVVRWLADLLGADRLAWCSDWPNAGEDYAALVARGVASTARLDVAERALFLAGTALSHWPELRPRRDV